MNIISPLIAHSVTKFSGRSRRQTLNFQPFARAGRFPTGPLGVLPFPPLRSCPFTITISRRLMMSSMRSRRILYSQWPDRRSDDDEEWGISAQIAHHAGEFPALSLLQSMNFRFVSRSANIIIFARWVSAPTIVVLESTVPVACTERSWLTKSDYR